MTAKAVKKVQEAPEPAVYVLGSFPLQLGNS